MFQRVRQLLPFAVLVSGCALTLAGFDAARAPAASEPQPALQPQDQPASTKPSDKRVDIATYAGTPRKGAPSILVQRRRDQETWTRVAPDAAVFTSDHLVSLPGYASELRTKSGVQLLLWGTLPEINLKSPTCPFVFESAVTLHDNPKVALDFTLERGRVYLSNHKDQPASVRLRFGKESWNIVLKERDTEIVLELFSRYTDKINYRKGEEPLSNLTLFVARGTASLTSDRDNEARVLEGPPGPALVAWNNKGRRPEGPFKIDKDSPVISFLGKEPPNPESAKALKEFRPALEEVNKLVSDKKPANVILLEGVQSGKSANEKALCIYGLAAIDAVPALLDVLGDENAETVPEREEAVIALRRWTSRGPQTPKLLYDDKAKTGLLLDKGYKPVEAESLVQLLYLQISDATAQRKDTYETLISYLRHRKMPIRELAYYHLKQLTFGLKGMPPYDPSWNVERRKQAADEWEALLKKGELPPTAPPK